MKFRKKGIFQQIFRDFSLVKTKHNQELSADWLIKKPMPTVEEGRSMNDTLKNRPIVFYLSGGLGPLR